MIAIDTSVLIAAMVDTEAHHQTCVELLDSEDVGFYAHGITEAFNTLTGGRRPFRIPAQVVHRLLSEDYLPSLDICTLTPEEMLDAVAQCESRGVRGAAIFDYLHLASAAKAGAKQLYTLNLTHFRAFYRVGDPEIMLPSL